jgi:AmiR/NasT family two-component response regulator
MCSEKDHVPAAKSPDYSNSLVDCLPGNHDATENTRTDAPAPDAEPIVCVEVSDRAPWTQLISDLRTCGIQTHWADEAPAIGTKSASTLRLVELSIVNFESSGPVIAIARQATPEAMQAALRAGAFQCLVMPINALNLASGIRSAARAAGILTDLLGRLEKLSAALKSEQSASVVVGILMERFHLTQAQAYEQLRRYARRERRRVPEVAVDVVTGLGQAAGLLQSIANLPKQEQG